MKIKSHPFFCHEKGCRKTIKETPEYLNNKIDIIFLREIHLFLITNDRLGFNNCLREFTGKITESNFKEEIMDLFFNRVIGWPEGKTYYREASEDYQIVLWNGFIDDYQILIQEFLKDK